MTSCPFTRGRTITRCLDDLARDHPSIRALEVGRIRSVTETTGHSTKHIACHPAVATLVSVDASAATRKPALEVVAAEHHGKIEFVDQDAIAWLADADPAVVGTFDFIYLDGLNDADFCLKVLALAATVAAPGAIIIQDDTDGPPNVVKGDRVKPYAYGHPELFEVLADVPHDVTCHGMLVLRMP